MRLINIVKNLVLGFLQPNGQDWWVEITTVQPRCTYYFGPFSTFTEASEAQYGYIDDLKGEGAKGIEVVVKRCKPAVLTICDEEF